jgi:hypothetical protein
MRVGSGCRTGEGTYKESCEGTMARIEGVAAGRASWTVRFAYFLARRMVGKVPEPLRVAAHHGDIFRAYSGYEFFLGRAKKVDARLKSLASLKAATRIGCPF